MTLAATHDPDIGKLPHLLQMYRDQNWLQLYADGAIRDPRLWVQLGLAADHVDFVGFISRFASQHPSTKATTELLFLLDKVAQASLETLVTLLSTNPKEHLGWTRTANRDAYDLIAEIQRYYSAQLEQRGLRSRQALAVHYDKVRLAILDGILQTTPSGYRANDARFLIGAIYWQQGRAQDARQCWREIAVDPTDSYVTAYSKILAALLAAGAQASVDGQDFENPLRREIKNILDGEHGRWVMFSYDRLQRFGYHVDTF
jgi:hypothetical protein